jgi:DNA-binding MarR family transcriptional regulator
MHVSSEALEAARLIDRLERLARFGEQSGDLNPAQWEALRYLWQANRFSRTPAALADYLASTRGTISRTLASLETKGYVERRSNLRDGRSVEFVLTGKAAAALEGDPLFALAEDIEKAAGDEMAPMLEGLRRTLRTAIARNRGRAFGACRSCSYFRADVRPGSSSAHHCGLLDEPLSDEESGLICAEHRPRAA